MASSSGTTISPTPFHVEVPQKMLDEVQTLLKLSPLPPATYEGTVSGFGVTSEWMKTTKAYWQNEFSWRKRENLLNQYPQFRVPLTGRDGKTYTIHYVGIFSERKDAVPLLLLHGWPGSFVEFYPLIPYLIDPAISPAFHLIIPSLPGFAYSSPPPLDRDFGLHDVAHLMDALMTGLGFTSYIAQGGDLGSIISRLLGAQYPACAGVHSNLVFLRPRPDRELPAFEVDDVDREAEKRASEFAATGFAYAMEHATKPSTIAHVIASNPLALLAWIGEKFLAWTDEDPTLDQILEIVTLWWTTQTFPTSIYAYRHINHEEWTMQLPGEKLHLKVPLGFSSFPKELAYCPEGCAAMTGNLVFFKRHVKGGHFAALEVPELLGSDIVEFAKKAWAQGSGQ